MVTDSRCRQRQVTFYAPSLKHFETSEFKQQCDCALFPVSITGSACSLMCDHCHARILDRMPAAITPEELLSYARQRRREGGAGLLISGGSDDRGRVPLEPFTSTMRRIDEELDMKVAVHTGITSSSLAKELAAANVETVLIDIIGSNATIGEVCHLDGIGSEDYAASLDNLCAAGLTVVPHVVIGLHRGSILGERDALRMIREHDIQAVVLIGLRPLPGTPMENVEPPLPEDMARIFHFARELFPDKAVLLGCERPGGKHKEETDRLALEAGLDGIAFPADGVVGLARSMGLITGFSEMCCALPAGKRKIINECGVPMNEITGSGGAVGEECSG
jgi:uncharacterized radical SAM superfamily protein